METHVYYRYIFKKCTGCGDEIKSNYYNFAGCTLQEDADTPSFTPPPPSLAVRWCDVCDRPRPVCIPSDSTEAIFSAIARLEKELSVESFKYKLLKNGKRLQRIHGLKSELFGCQEKLSSCFPPPRCLFCNSTNIRDFNEPNEKNNYRTYFTHNCGGIIEIKPWRNPPVPRNLRVNYDGVAKTKIIYNSDRRINSRPVPLDQELPELPDGLQAEIRAGSRAFPVEQKMSKELMDAFKTRREAIDRLHEDSEEDG